MGQGRCKRCGGRLHVRSQGCRQCGAARVHALPPSRTPRGWRGTVLYLMAFVLLMVSLLGARQAVTSEAVANWYTDIALQHLPQHFTALVPADENATGAYNFCIRQVVRKMTPSGSVETFPSSSAENTIALGESRYRVESFFFEDRVTGERVQQYFTCTARLTDGRWVLEDLSPGRYARVD